MALTKIDDRGLKTPIDLLDNEKIRFGTGDDLELYHTGSASYISNSTGFLFIHGNDIALRSTAGENYIVCDANTEVELYYDGSKKLETASYGAITTGTHQVTGNFEMVDNGQAIFGTGADLKIYHDGSASWIKDEGTGGLNILSNLLWLGNAGGTETFIQCTEDGAVQLYHNNVKKFETVSDGVKVTAAEGGVAILYLEADEGDDNADYYRLQNDGSVFYLQNKTSGSWENNLKATGNGAVELYYDNSKKFETTSTGSLFHTSLKGADGADILLGNSDDLQLYHDGSNSNIKNTTGWLNVSAGGSGFSVGNGDFSENLFKATNNAAVELYYDNSKKFETTTSGVAITGNGTFDAAGQNYIRIGSTDASGAILTLDGDSNGDGSGADYCMIMHDTDGHLKIYADNPANAANIQFYSNATTERMRIHSNGKVGIGTDSPTRYLHVKETAGGDAQIIVETTANAERAQIEFKSPHGTWVTGTYGGNTTGDWLTYTAGDHNAIFHQNGSEKLRIQSGGGISFNGDSAAANALSDYEEGTWSGSLVANGSPGTTYGTSTGRYTKIGRMCTVSIWFDGVDCSGITLGNYIQIIGCPFTGISGFGDTSHNTFTSNVGLTAGRKHFFKMQGNGTKWTGYESRDDNTSQPWYTNDWDSSNLTLFFTGHFTTNT